jgi:hypothetical protein
MRGNLISFQVYFDSKGNLMTELSKLPLEGLSLFNDADRPYVKKILNEAGLKLEGLHEYLTERTTGVMTWKKYSITPETKLAMTLRINSEIVAALASVELMEENIEIITTLLHKHSSFVLEVSQKAVQAERLDVKIVK